jgi:hypothetical protein
MTRTIATVVRKARLGEIDEDAERRSYWAATSPATRIAELEEIRRVWIALAGDPDAPFVRVMQRRALR